ncbi:hypothetical protein M5F66_10620 [Acinetobacter sp. ANC 5033]|nr:hypothetical protein [Acinetobacter sp. YH12045]MCL6238776.1 hypothetical protein [Acinetobacter amyesii]
MLKLLILLCGMASPLLFAQTIYELRESNGEALLTNKDTKYSNLKVEKKTYYPEDGFETKWNVHCSKDRFNGLKSCSISTYASDVFVYFSKGQYSILIGRNHYPRTSSAIKIDDNAAIYGYEGISETPLKVLKQMMNGKIAYTRYKEWPYEYNKDNEVKLDGFSEAIEKMKTEYKNL